MKKIHSLIPLTIVLLGLNFAAQASDNQLGIAFTNARVYGSGSDGNGSKFFFQHQYNDTLGLEVAYGKYGSYNTFDYPYGTTTHDYKALNVAAVWGKDINETQRFYGKLGLSRWSAGTFDGDDSGINPLVGLGLDFKLNTKALFKLEAEILSNSEYDNPRSFNVGLALRF